jgi:hypothetical protein
VPIRIQCAVNGVIYRPGEILPSQQASAVTYLPLPAPWNRHRFRADATDYRPVLWPPPGPYWCTGHGDDYSTVVAYLPVDVSVTALWPEATHIDTEEVNEIVFTERFPRPAWWKVDQL